MNDKRVVDFSNRELYNATYIPLLHCKKRYVFLMGGSGSGKSVFQAQKEIINTYRPGNRLLAVRKIKDTIKDSMFAELIQVIEDWGLVEHFSYTRSPLYIRNLQTGSDIVFRGMDDPEKVKSIKGVSRVWFEEATEGERGDFDQIDLRIRGKKDMQITCTFNPIDDEHWLNTDFWQHGITDTVELKHTTFLDNRFIGPEYRAVLERLKGNSRMYDIYALGKWGKSVEGVILQYEDIDCVPRDAVLLGYGQDFGYTNDPSAFTAIYRYNGEIILDEVFYRPGLRNSDIAGLYKSNGVSPDSTIWGDSSEPKSIDEIASYGYNIRGVKKGPDSVNFGIGVMQQHKIRITLRSTNVRKEFKNYVWKTDKHGKALNEPIDAFNHAIDGVRYFFMMEMRSNQEADVISFIGGRKRERVNPEKRYKVRDR